MPDAADFDSIVTDSFVQHAASPELEDPSFDDFRGLQIRAPEVVPLSGNPDLDGTFTRLVIAGALHLDSNYLGLREVFLERVVLVGVDRVRLTAWARHLEVVPNRWDTPHWAEYTALSDQDLANRSVMQYFTVNAARTLSLPREPAEYVFYATLGQYVSNRVFVTVKR